MRIPILLLSIALACVVSIAAQGENTAQPIWERYRIPEKDLSVMLPKLPTAYQSYDACTELERSSYYAYAEGVAYEISIVAKLKRGARPGWCSTYPASRQQTIDDRLDEIREGKEKPIETVIDVPGLDVRRFSTPKNIRQVVSEPSKKRWIELAVTHYPDAKPDVDEFLGSLQFSSAGKGIDDGAKSTLGDPMDEDSKSVVERLDESSDRNNQRASDRDADKKSNDKTVPIKPTDVPPGSSPVILVSKPRATYTDAARRAGVQGAVRMKVTLLKNGAVGKITILKDLSHGLTEQAVYAARRLVFLPKKVDNAPVSSVVTLEYSFAIY